MGTSRITPDIITTHEILWPILDLSPYSNISLHIHGIESKHLTPTGRISEIYWKLNWKSGSNSWISAWSKSEPGLKLQHAETNANFAVKVSLNSKVWLELHIEKMGFMIRLHMALHWHAFWQKSCTSRCAPKTPAAIGITLWNLTFKS